MIFQKSSQVILTKPKLVKERETTEHLPTISSIEDIELFEKQNNCVFAFVGSWGKTVYKVGEFLKNYKEEYWKERAIRGANNFKGNCRSKGSEALFWNSSGFNVHADSFK